MSLKHTIIEAVWCGIVLVVTAVVFFTACTLFLGCAADTLSPEQVDQMIGARVGDIETTVAALAQQQTAGRDVNTYDRGSLWLVVGGAYLMAFFYPLVWRPLVKRRRKNDLRGEIAFLVSEAVELKNKRHKH